MEISFLILRLKCFFKVLVIDNFESVIFNRGIYWVNYVIGFGVFIYEFGYCFDLVYIFKGIMGRGFDDMNSVFIMWRYLLFLGEDIVVIVEFGKLNIFGLCILKVFLYVN